MAANVTLLEAATCGEVQLRLVSMAVSSQFTPQKTCLPLPQLDPPTLSC